jgi:leucyl/phenylalanyl-tRNA--protein transferase
MPLLLSKHHSTFPPPHFADEEGLLAIGGDLSTERLLEAYRNGIFPWYSEDYPILWWSPDPRMVLSPEKLIVSDSLRRLINQKKFSVRFDTCFEQVIRHCAAVSRKDQEGTWITEEMIRAYTRLHESGYAHSVETFSGDELAGGLYGISIGKAFFGESMFHLKRDASKVALFHLVERLKMQGFHLIDVQQETSHLERLGAETIPRNEFLALLTKAVNINMKPGKWKNQI